MPDVSGWYLISNLTEEQKRARTAGEEVEPAKQDRLEAYPKSGVVWHCMVYHPCEARNSWVAIAHWAGAVRRSEIPVESQTGQTGARAEAVRLLLEELKRTEDDATSPDYLLEQVPVIREQLADY